MKIYEARTLLRAGHISSAEVIKHSDEEGWVLKLNTTNNSDFSNLIHTDKGKVRIFKSTDAALSAAKTIGFNTATVFL